MSSASTFWPERRKRATAMAASMTSHTASTSSSVPTPNSSPSAAPLLRAWTLGPLDPQTPA